MKVTDLTRMALTARREEKRMKAAGYERIGETGGMLWELTRGVRMRQIIKDVVIAADGKSLWVRIGDIDPVDTPLQEAVQRRRATT